MTQFPYFQQLSLTPTIVFEDYWWFAAERHRILERRLAEQPAPWTQDPILQRFKFTNTFRTADRIGQYLLREIVNQPSSDQHELFFKIILFKIFNTETAWELLRQGLGAEPKPGPGWRKAIDEILIEAMEEGIVFWSAAYVMNQKYQVDLKYKHSRYLALLEQMLDKELPAKLASTNSYQAAFGLLRGYTLMGNFVAMQYLTDLNYSRLIDFSENDFIMAGPGAFRGINKCFGLNLNPNKQVDRELAAEIIRVTMEQQDQCLALVGEKPIRLMGKRPLSLIDCQNVYCETDKYSRVAHPDLNRKASDRIKQTFKPTNGAQLPALVLPEKWHDQ